MTREASARTPRDFVHTLLAHPSAVQRNPDLVNGSSRYGRRTEDRICRHRDL